MFRGISLLAGFNAGASKKVSTSPNRAHFRQIWLFYGKLMGNWAKSFRSERLFCSQLLYSAARWREFFVPFWKLEGSFGFKRVPDHLAHFSQGHLPFVVGNPPLIFLVGGVDSQGVRSRGVNNRNFRPTLIHCSRLCTNFDINRARRD